jgi:hypothetical protein
VISELNLVIGVIMIGSTDDSGEATEIFDPKASVYDMLV